MPPVPGSSSTPNPQTTADLEAGLAAVKQGDYVRAIELLEAAPSGHPLYTRVQMGLAVAYAKSGEPLQALTLCQSLVESDAPQVREWAMRTQSSLVKRYPDLSRELHTSTPQPRLEMGSDTIPDLTGFMPFTDSPASQAIDTTGFAPLPEPLQANGVRRVDEITEVAEKASIPQPPSPSPPPSAPHSWQHAGRLPRGQSLGKLNLAPLLLAQVGTAIVLFWMVQQILYRSNLMFRHSWNLIPFVFDLRVLIPPPVWSIVILLGVLFVGSRWLLDGLLMALYGLEPLSLSKLGTYSPETTKSLSVFCRQRKIPLPALGVLPIAAPVSFSYGVIPHVTRVVVSQGLLEQLADDEIAAVYASEIGQISGWTVPLMSLATIAMQIPYTLYWQLSELGNRQASIPLIRSAIALVASVFYGIYALIRWTALWLSRQRVYFSDRAATELTGNPNGLTRALVKSAIGIAKDVQQQRQTRYLLEGFDLLMPLGHRMATTLGILAAHTALEPLLEWDRSSPYRHWLSLNNSHPPTGDRLNLLTLYARHWKLDAELSFASSGRSLNRAPAQALTSRQWRTLLLQGAPFVGLGVGLLLVGLLSLAGWIGLRTDIDFLAWMYRDVSISRALPVIGFSIGTLIRLNAYFPNIQPSSSADAVSPTLPELLKTPTATPIASSSIQLQGTLLGRAGLSSVLSQDLLLQTAAGIIRLHCVSPWGPIGNLLPQPTPFTALIGQEVTVTGWFRRGATPWIDVETLRTSGGRTHRSQHPVWSTVFAVLAALWGAYTIARGGIYY
ncbi:M48 family metalloprotease [Leptolyngbya sp. FACHB-36]|uniref:M48 family metalloprotease n=1 Tax=Leptolyngbya sp. FACHB-36 TaxID=2692808 RepID=UPI00167FFE53|nr:M48 family metalloprotease [Leptolyngbya sp. FACHB-36]MBD2020163.1 M48 family metalloprotease [Leptolyngbya sp. FACHB-36]